jgi:DNA-directed RNA polymerase specialized sigma24 family protein
LPENLRAVMSLHSEGLDHHQIAADLDLPIRIVNARFHRAKLALHRILER